ncbi:2-polyprenyl-3-methyl-5-hydroxy-6-metoxy-1,4-benzoquinol methylase [Lysobacter enzymogenes]|uniref:Methyltransferase type 12 n=2 Tax=Bacteria TaxID=2 RepID=A0AAU9AFU3_LYSEN|nr:class I SAM-dependent methyltransferase [Lysobacter enzymogenes]BAV96454.1 methyltransferase type 12 [Lysobacter enzymogenes]
MNASNPATDTATVNPDGKLCLACLGDYGPSKLPGLKQCVRCGFITADMSISEEELAALYGEDYFHGEEYRNYVSEEASLKDNFRRRIVTLQQLIPDLKQRELFEVGCAYGFFLDEVKNDVASARGIDISRDAIAHAREHKGVNAIAGNYAEYPIERPVGMLAMWDTIEHLPRPDVFIEKAAHDVAPGGFIAVTTGDIDSFNARMRGKHWRMIHPPTHMHYFSVATLSKLLERNGFEVVHVSHPGNARNLRSILHFILDLRLGWGGLYRAIADWKIFDLSISMNLFDIMFVVARRKA